VALCSLHAIAQEVLAGRYNLQTAKHPATPVCITSSTARHMLPSTSSAVEAEPLVLSGKSHPTDEAQHKY
jgi:hypothetical protein